MATLTVQLPGSANIGPKNFLTFAAARLHEAKKLTLGRAAELAGYAKATFMELLGNYGVSVFNYPAPGLAKDVKNVQSNNISIREPEL